MNITFPAIVAAVEHSRSLRAVARMKNRPFDWLELRLDLFDKDFPECTADCVQIRKAGVPVLLTLRSQKEGGRWKGREAERMDRYAIGLPYADVVDIEWGSRGVDRFVAFARCAGKKIIISHHDFKRTPSLTEMTRIIHAARKQGADIVKLASMVRNSEDAIRLFDVLKLARQGPLCVLGMGPLGMFTRVGLVCCGSCLTYGYIQKPTAPGQLSCTRLRALLDEFC